MYTQAEIDSFICHAQEKIGEIGYKAALNINSYSSEESCNEEFAQMDELITFLEGLTSEYNAWTDAEKAQFIDYYRYKYTIGCETVIQTTPYLVTVAGGCGNQGAITAVEWTAATYLLTITTGTGQFASNLVHTHPWSDITATPTTLAGYGITDAQPLDATLTALVALDATAGLLVQTGVDAFAKRTLTGTADRISVSNATGAAGNPTVDIASTYAGQATIATVGTIGAGVWQGTAVATGFGGTGQNFSATVADRMIYTTGVGVFGVTPVTAFARTILDDADAGTVRGTIGGTTIGQNVFTSTNPSAIRFGRANADNTFDWLSAADFRTAIGAGSGSGDVTKVGTPVNNQIGVWTGNGTIEGDANLTWDGIKMQFGATDNNFIGSLNINGTALEEFSLYSNEAESSATGLMHLTSVVEAVTDTGTSSLIKIRGIRDGNLAVVTRPILSIFNQNTKLAEVAANGTWNYQGNTLSNIGQLNVDNFRLDGNIISITDTNGSITLASNGTGITTITGQNGGFQFRTQDYKGTTTGAIITNGSTISPGDAIGMSSWGNTFSTAYINTSTIVALTRPGAAGEDGEIEFYTSNGATGVASTNQLSAKLSPSGFYLYRTTNQLILGTTNTTTINSVAPAASRVYTIPDALGTANFALTDVGVINGVPYWSNAGKLTNSATFTYDGTDFNIDANIVNLHDVTFRTGAIGGTIRTGTSAADKFVLQAYKTGAGAGYQTVIELDAGATPVLQLRANFLEIDDNTDSTKRVLWDVAGATTGTATTLDFNQTVSRTITFPDATGTLVLADATQTLTNKTINLTSNTITGTIAQFNTALSDGDFATLAGTETLSNKTLQLTTIQASGNTYSGTITNVDGASADLSYLAIAGKSGGTSWNIRGDGKLFTGTSSPESSATFQANVASGTNEVYVTSASLANGNSVNSVAKGTIGGLTRTANIGVYKHAGIANAAGYIFLQEDDGGNNFLWVDNSGNLRISATDTHVGTTSGTVVGDQTSDERLKDIDSTFDYGLNEVKELKPIRYKFKDSEIYKLGFGAQTTAPIIPESVYDSKEVIQGDSKNTKLVMDNSAIIPVLVKAIQEQQAQIESLAARVVQLENK